MRAEPHEPAALVDMIIASRIAEGGQGVAFQDPPTLRRQDVADVARDAGLQPWADAIAASASPSLRLSIVEREVEVTGSHLGGEPALPADLPWPDRDGRPLAFLGQVDLSEVGSVGGGFGVPTQGLLSFFYDVTNQPWGFDPNDRDGSVVAWFPERDGLSLRPFPADLAEDDRFRPKAVAVSPEWTIPDWQADDALVVDLAATESDDRDELSDLYVELAQRLAGPPGNGLRSRMLGHPDLIQGDMRQECEFASHGHSVGGARPFAVEDRPVHEANASHWRLLLQLDSHEDLGMTWGDVGRVYFWIRDDDLQAARFDGAWLVLQCY